jgi:prephenate dehydratase
MKQLVNDMLLNQCENKNSDGNKEKLYDHLKIRIPIYIMPVIDRPGILFDILRRFYDNQINLISIMSRPTKLEMGTYNFYIEIGAFYKHVDIILDTLRQIQVYNDIKILGVDII